MKKMFKIVALATVLALLVFQCGVDVSPNSNTVFKIGQGRLTFTIGTVAHAAADVDYTCDGVADDVQFQAALNALPAAGGKLVVLTGSYAFTATVTRAIANVTIEGNGLSSAFAYDGANPIFTAGGNRWAFRNFQTDAGGVNVGATTGWVQQNVLLGATYYAYRTAGNVSAGSWDIPVGRGATFVVAANDASAASKAQADYLCDGTADDVEIQAAIDALPAGGGTVKLSEGTFNVADNDANGFCINLIDNLELEGMGVGKTIIKAVAAIGNKHLVGNASAGISFISIRDMTLDHNGQNLGETSGVHTVRLEEVTKVWLENLEIKNSSHHGIVTVPDTPSAVNTEYFVNNVYAHNIGTGGWNGGDAIRIFYGADRAVISNIIVDGVELHGVHIGLGACTLNNIIIRNYGRFGLAIQSEGMLGNNIHIEENIICDLIANRPVAGTEGRIFYATDTDAWSMDNGSNWITLAPVSAALTITTRPTYSTASRILIDNYKAVFNVIENQTYPNKGGQALYIEGNVHGVSINNFQIKGKWFEGILNRGTYTQISNGLIEGVLTRGISNGQASGNASQSNIYTAVTIKDAKQGSGTYDGMYLLPTSRDTIINGCVFKGAAVRYSFFTDATSSGHILTGNDFAIGTTGAAYMGAGAVVIARDNKGYVTENSGTATLLNGNTTVVVVHGLSATPTVILITFAEDPTNLMADWWVDTANSDNFTFNGVDPGASNLDFYWEAKVR